MPTVLRWDGHRAFFYSNEGHEPPHIHVESNGREVKFWLENLDLAFNFGFSEPEVTRIRQMLEVNKLQLIHAWRAHFGD